MKTWMAKNEEVDRNWWLVDATDQTVGRLATKIAMTLRGKTKPQFTPNTDTGDFVVVINSDKLKFTGNKLEQKKYYRHTGHFGGIYETSAKEQMDKDSTFVLTNAVKGMLPRNRLATQILAKLKVYKNSDHPHAAQKPQAMN